VLLRKELKNQIRMLDVEPSPVPERKSELDSSHLPYYLFYSLDFPKWRCVMPRVLKFACLFLFLSLVAAFASSPQQRLEGDPGRDDIVLEDFDSYGLRWEPVADFERASLRITGRQGLVWEQQFEAGETLDFDLVDLEGVPLDDGSYTYEWRLTVSSPDFEEGRRVKTQGGRFKIQDGMAASAAKLAPDLGVPLLTNTLGNHFVGNLTTDSKLCVGCIDGASADVTDADGIPQTAVIRSKGTEPGIILHEAVTPKEYWRITSRGGDLKIEDVASGSETGFRIPFTIEDRAANNSIYVASSGKIGLGTVTPTTPLHVNRSDGTARILVEEQSGTTAVRTLFQLWNNGAPRFVLGNSNALTVWSFQQSGPGNFLISLEGTGGPEMQVYQSGRVRMGPAGTASFDLDPTGHLTIAGSLTANGSVFPDYVFEPDYDLMPLSDLQNFIRQEKRLPDIPSAEEVQKQGGHNMTELQIKLLEKIEELTLYTLEQQEEIAGLKARLAEMATLKAELAEIRAALSER
jgi:hypothetical protein